MKNFIFGVLSAFGLLALCGKCYDKGVQDTKEQSSNKNEKKSKK